MRDLKSEEHEKLARLQRVKMLATLVLLLCFVVLITTKVLELRYPWLGGVAAFAEAAAPVNDWFTGNVARGDEILTALQEAVAKAEADVNAARDADLN